jgi:UDP-glucuronate 4-epimerase
MKKIIVTGAAGFIGFHLSLKLLKKKENIIFGLDNLNNYYDPKLKKSRLKILKNFKNFKFAKLDLKNYQKLKNIFFRFGPTHIINLAAQAGVRYSIQNPRLYLESNLIGFFNILDLSKTFKVKHFVYASTSSVYGANKKQPFCESDPADHPIQFYAATKRSNEIMAHSYSSLYKIPTTGLRFFTEREGGGQCGL